MAVPYQNPRGTRASLNTKQTNSQILAGQVYLVTDENRLYIGLTASTVQGFVKQGEVFSTTVSGLVPNPGSVTGKYLTDGGTWVDPLAGNITIGGKLTTTTSTAVGSLGSNGALFGYNSTFGAYIQGKSGSTYSFILFNEVGTGVLLVPSNTTTIVTAASNGSYAGLRLPHGTAPGTPTDGDFWSTTTGFYGRVNGTTVGPFGAGGGGGTTTNSVTFNALGTGSAPGTTFNGSTAITVSTNTIGAVPVGGITTSGLTTSGNSVILGRSAVGGGAVQELTGTIATSLLDVATTTTKGLVPPPGTSTGKVLQDDMTWITPATGGGGYTVVTRSATNTESATSGTVVVLCTATTNMTINLPTAVGNTAMYIIKKTALGGAVTVDASSTQTIDGGLTVVLTDQYETIAIVSDNANWWII